MHGRFFLLALAVGLPSLVVWVGCSSDDGNANPGLRTGDGGAPEAAPAATGQDAAPEAAAFVGKTITYGTCPSFTKCDSDVVGTWALSGGCLSSDTFATAKANCAGLKERDIVIKANGGVTVTATTMTLSTTINVTGKMLLPKSCVPIPGASCGTVALGLKSGLGTGGLKFDTATCVDAGDACDCDVGTTTKQESVDDYTTSGDGTLTSTTDAGAERTYDYCVQNGTLTFTETTTSQPLKMFIEATK